MAADSGLAARLQQAGLKLVHPLQGLAALGKLSAAASENNDLARSCLQGKPLAASASGHGACCMLVAAVSEGMRPS